jgi:hypothetical protein
VRAEQLDLERVLPGARPTAGLSLVGRTAARWIEGARPPQRAVQSVEENRAIRQLV